MDPVQGPEKAKQLSESSEGNNSLVKKKVLANGP